MVVIYRLSRYFDLSLGLFSKICCAMKTMLSEQVHTFEEKDVCLAICRGIPYFRACDVTLALRYADTTQAVRKNVSDRYIRTLTELCKEASGDILSAGQFIPEMSVGRPALYISEPW